MLFMVYGVLICLAIVLISYFFWNCCQKVFFIKRLHTLPGPKPLPLIGNIHHVLLKTPEELMDTVLKMTEDYSSPLQVWIGSKLLIGIYEPDQIKIILRNNNNIEKSIAYKFTSPFLGIGLLTAPASIWIRMRTAIAPTFSARMLQGFFNTFVEQSVIFAHKLEKVGLNENEINLQDYISNCTWRIACDSILGIKLEPHKNNQCVKAIQRLKNIFARRVTNIFLFPNVIFNLTALGRVQAKTINTICSLVDEMIQQRTHESNNLNTTKDEDKRTHRTFFDILMEALHKKNLTQEEIYDNILTMLITASDSITVTMNFTLFMLANFPEIQEKIYKELLEIYGTETVKSAPVKYDDLQYMHYLDRVIKETMRIFPPAPLIGRVMTEDLKMGKFVIPKGADVIIPIIKLHRNEKYWSNPLVFDPDRFLPEKIKNSDLYYNAPFGDGPRICIGMKYAMICMKVILATLIRTFVLEVDESIEIDKIKLKFDTLLASVEPLKVKIKKR